MNRAEIRIIENQSESFTPISISDWEKNQLLLKYGYSQNLTSNTQISNHNPTSELSYQELMDIEDKKYFEKINNHIKIPQHKSYTIDNDMVQYNETKFSNVDMGGVNLGMDIQIYSDMKINR